MTRREYVSFLGERRRDFGYYDRGPNPTRWLWVLVAVAFIAVSVWWFGIRDTDDEVAAERLLEDTTVPSVLLPSGFDIQEETVASASLECIHLVEEWHSFQGDIDRDGCVTARRVEQPKMLWHTEVGVQGWLNNPVIENGAVFVGSAGVAQFSQDRRDGIYSLDLTTGTQRWLYTTELDVNGVSVDDGVVVGTGDEGRVWGISARDGSLLWTDDLGVGVFGSPLILDDLVVIGDGNGIITAYDLNSGVRRWEQTVQGAVRGGASSDGNLIFVAGEERQVVALDRNGGQVWRVDVTARGSGGSQARIFAAPTVTDTMVIISLVRDDVFAEPALLALDKQTGELVWRAQDVAGLKTQWANIRSSPALAGDLLIFGEGYSDGVIALDLLTGETRWSVQAGVFCYPHWPSPAVNNGLAYVARHDGGLYAIDLETQELRWSLYLGEADGTGAFPADYGEGFCDWGPETGFSILASPAVGPEGIIVVGTLEGQLIAVGGAEWED